MSTNFRSKKTTTQQRFLEDFSSGLTGSAWGIIIGGSPTPSAGMKSPSAEKQDFTTSVPSKKKHGTHNPPHSDLDPPWKSSRKKTKWLGLKKDDPWIQGFQWAKFGLLGRAGPNLDGQYLTKSFFVYIRRLRLLCESRVTWNVYIVFIGFRCLLTPQRIMWANSFSTETSHVVSNPSLWEIKILHVADVLAKIVVGNNLHVASWREHPTTVPHLNTPWKINMDPTNHPIRKENDLSNLHDYVPC